MKIGVLALQGAFSEHRAILGRLSVESIEVRLPEQLKDLDGLIIPGGESTTMGKLAGTYGLMEPLRSFGKTKAIWGTCAGAIMLAKHSQYDQPLLNLMDIDVDRNAFGRQVDSFEANLRVEKIEQEDRLFHAVFIRAPLILKTGIGVEVLARMPETEGRAGGIVAARQGKLLATVFHPELTGDDRFHRLFLRMVEGS